MPLGIEFRAQANLGFFRNEHPTLYEIMVRLRALQEPDRLPIAGLTPTAAVPIHIPPTRKTNFGTSSVSLNKHPLWRPRRSALAKPLR